MSNRGKHVVILDIPKMETECEFTVDEFLGKKARRCSLISYI